MRLYLNSQNTENVTSFDDRLLSTTPGLTLSQANTVTPAGPLGVASWSLQINNVTPLFLTNPLAATTIAAVTFTVNFWAYESSTLANTGLEMGISRYNGNGGWISDVYFGEMGAELPLVSTAQNWSGTTTVTTIAEGDRLGIILFIQDAGGTMASGHTIRLNFGGTTPGADGDSWVEIGQELVELPVPSLYVNRSNFRN